MINYSDELEAARKAEREASRAAYKILNAEVYQAQQDFWAATKAESDKYKVAYRSGDRGFTGAYLTYLAATKPAHEARDEAVRIATEKHEEAVRPFKEAREAIEAAAFIKSFHSLYNQLAAS